MDMSAVRAIFDKRAVETKAHDCNHHGAKAGYPPEDTRHGARARRVATGHTRPTAVKAARDTDYNFQNDWKKKVER